MAAASASAICFFNCRVSAAVSGRLPAAAVIRTSVSGLPAM
jgi:hypothetical protein